MKEIMLQVQDLSKEYRLGQIGGTTLREELQRVGAKWRGKEDPTAPIGAKVSPNEKLIALKNVNFTVHRGERVGIIGHNGAGKSTLLKLISRITAPTTGEIGLNGRITSMLEVGTGFHAELTGMENIYLNGAILGMSKKEIDAKRNEIVAFSECDRFIDTPVKRYSSGMYVKLAFSVAAHLDSDIVIMDEVLAVGDAAFQQKCIDKMNEISRTEGRTVLYVSHNMSTIRKLCDRVLVLDHGELVFDGGVEEGIAIYLKSGATEKTEMDYETVPRYAWLTDAAVCTKKAAFIGKENAVFKREERMKIQLTWHNDCDVKDLCLRTEVVQMAHTPVGSFILEDFYSGKKGENGTVTFSVGLSELVAGRYYLNFTFFDKKKSTVFSIVDHVKGMVFRVTDECDITWNRAFWGSVHFADARLEEE